MPTVTEDKFTRDLETYQKMGGTVDELSVNMEETYGTDFQYLYMGYWAFEKIYNRRPYKHVSIGDQLSFLLPLSLHTKVDLIDIRDPQLFVPNFRFLKGDVTKLPHGDNSIESLSCLHVAEHVGLGRYGDTLDPEGFSKACQELKRVLAYNGLLYFAVPMGKPRTVFNAHRVLSSKQVFKEFEGLRLLEMSGIDHLGHLYHHMADTEFLDQDRYACGLFIFQKEEPR